MSPARGVIVITGTDTGVGKTIVTAAIAAAARAAGLRVAMVKPAQTGDDDDARTVERLAAPATVTTLARFPDPLAPLAAAQVAEQEPLDLIAISDAIKEIDAGHDLTLIEGAGGLLVPMGLRPGGEAWTLADLAMALQAPAVVVARAGLGTLNHTALTLEALERRGIAGRVVLGEWPQLPELVHFTNLRDLPGDLCGMLPAGAGAIEPGVFQRSAPGWLTEPLYGVCDDPRDLALSDVE